MTTKTLPVEIEGETLYLEHVWSPGAWDYSSQQSTTAIGTIHYKKLGAWVLTDKSASKIMNRRHGFKAYEEE